MKLFQRLFFAAVLTGLAAGLAMSAVQHWQVIPLILEAEEYETAEPAVTAAEHSHEAEAAAHEHDAAAADHTHDEDAWAPQDGAERTFYTVLANLLNSIGFALLIGAVSVLAGIEITARNGIVWGLAGFAAFQLAPAFGLAPELPGMAAAELGTRQVWWWATALATGLAALGIAKFRSWPAVVIGAVLILLPHVIGAPPAPDEPSAVPAHLATAFAAKSLGTGAVFWLIAGPLLGWLNERFARMPAFALKEANA
jgi:cobalt transporter subunit CbtA